MTDNRIRWDVRIQFEDGEHAVLVWAETQLGAFRLALQDARMAHPFGSFASPVVSWDAVPTEMEIAA
jgi:hypothetical protein